MENLEFTEAFKNPLCAYVFVYVERIKKKKKGLSQFPESLKASSLKIHIRFLKSQMCQFLKYTFMPSGVIKQRMR